MEHSLVERAPRLAMVVEVMTSPELPECWSTNVSRSGIGLVCAGGVETLVREREVITVQFELPGSHAEVHARGEVVWLYGRPSRFGDGVETALGVRFSAIALEDRVAFDRFLLEKRFHVAAALASPAEQSLLAEAVGAYCHLHREDSEAGLIDLLARGDLSAVVVFADETDGAPNLVRRVIGAPLKGAVTPPDLLPLIIYCSGAFSADLVELFNSGRLSRALPKPVSVDALRRAVQEACSVHSERVEQRRVAHSLERAVQRQRERSRSEAARWDLISERLVHKSVAMAHVLDLVGKVAPHKVSVLLQGETGTGKEVLATLLHDLSPRAAASLVIQDCGVLSETLLESELFGHVKGAFTGAVADHPGLFVMADGGTVFLDEIENTTPGLQAKLLRAIEAGVVRPVGSAKVRRVDVRVVAASNKSLAEEVAAGRFRQDLFFRLNAFLIRVPPLRERAEDIPPLAQHFLKLTREKLQARALSLAPRAERALCEYAWPGNIRELRNAVESAVLMSGGAAVIDFDSLPESVRGASVSVAPAGTSLKGRVDDYECDLIRRALAQNAGVVRRAARELAMSPVTLRRKALAYGLLQR